jgi:hypothetical protein
MIWMIKMDCKSVTIDLTRKAEGTTCCRGTTHDGYCSCGWFSYKYWFFGGYTGGETRRVYAIVTSCTVAQGGLHADWTSERTRRWKDVPRRTYTWKTLWWWVQNTMDEFINIWIYAWVSVLVEWRWTAYEQFLGATIGQSEKDSAEAVWEQATRNVRTFVGTRMDNLFAIQKADWTTLTDLHPVEGWYKVWHDDFLGFDEIRLKKSDTVCYNGMAFYNGQWNWDNWRTRSLWAQGQNTKFSAKTSQNHGLMYGILEEGDWLEWFWLEL